MSDVAAMADDITYDINAGGLCTAKFVGGSSIVGLVEVTAYNGKKFLVQVSELEEI